MKQTNGFRPILLRLFFICLLTFLSLPLAAAARPAENWTNRHYAETGQDVAGPFLTFFDRHGGLAQFGYPLTPVRWEGSHQVQYFERQRFEYHPDKAGTPFEVQLGRLGARLTLDSGRSFPAGTARANDAGNRWFPATSHNLQGRFLAYWNANGGLPIYGMPISEELREKSATDGKEYTVQYFERARFELHPENSAPYDVLLGRLGYDFLVKLEGKAPRIVPGAAPQETSARQAPAATAPQAPAAAGPVPPAEFQAGMNLTGWWSGAYASADSNKAIEQLARSGTGWVSLLTTWFQHGGTSSSIAPDGAQTPTDASLRTAIRTAHGLGLKVTLKPHVDCYDHSWRGHIQPADLNAWFASYKNMILHYARLAAEEKVEQLVIGTELYTLNTSQDTGPYWRPIIAEIRKVYGGKLTYGANWAKQNAEFEAITWWDAVDYIGVDGYYPLSTKHSPSLDELKSGWTSYTDNWGQTYRWLDQVKAVQAKWNKPVVFVEIGYYSNPTGAAVYDIPQANWADADLQARAYEAMFQVWSAQPWWAGVYPWNWDINPGAGGSGDAGMVLNNKPAMSVIGGWYARLAKK